MTSDRIQFAGYEVGRIFLAPMAGFTDVAFRTLARENGAALTVTEMVSVRGLVHGNAATSELTELSEEEKPSCVQLFGSCPRDFERAAKLVDCDIIDINMGCPMPKIVKNGDGAALMLNPVRAAEIVSAVKNAVDKPVTVKTRLGYAMGEECVGELIEYVARAGASAVTVHGRFAEQRYAGSSDPDAVERIAKFSPVPVVASGDIDRGNIDSALSRFYAVMIGRAALGDLGIFCGKKLSATETARRHIALLTEHFDERYTVFQARKFFVHYFKGMAGGKAARTAVNAANTVSDLYAILDTLDKAMPQK